MKVLIISHTYISPVNRTKWQTLAKHYPSAQLMVLVPARWKTSFFDMESGKLTTDNLKNCHFVSLPVYFAGNELLYFYSPLKFAKLLRTFKPDIIHVEQGLHATSYFQAIFFNKLLRIKARCSFFTWVNWEPIFGLKTKLLTKILGFFNTAGSAGAIAGNADAKSILTATKPTLPVEVMPQLGVSIKLFRPALLVPEENDKKFIIYVGRIIEEKGLMTLLKAFSRLSHHFPQWHLRIVGSGTFEKYLIDYALSKKLLQRVEFQPPVSHEKIAEILRTAEILVLPSLDTPYWREQFGHVLIEAMASHVCVVGSNAGEMPNVIGEGGIIFPQGDEQALYEILKKLISDASLRADLAKKGFERVLHHYTHEIIAHKTYKFWQSLIQP